MDTWKNAFFLQENLHVHKIPRFFGGGSADFIFMGAGIFLKNGQEESRLLNLRRLGSSRLAILFHAMPPIARQASGASFFCHIFFQGTSLWIAIGHFYGKKWGGCSSDSLRYHRKRSATGLLLHMSRDKAGGYFGRVTFPLFFFRFFRCFFVFFPFFSVFFCFFPFSSFFSVSSLSPKAGHPKAGRSDFRNQRFKPDTGKMRKMRTSLPPHENKGLRRFRRTETLKTRKMRTRKRGKCGKCG